MPARQTVICLTVACALTLGACSSAVSASDQAQITEGLMTMLRKKAQINTVRGSYLACLQVFRLGDPKIVDTTLTGDTGKLRIQVPVTAVNPVDQGPLFDPSIRYYYPSSYCYGSPASGWTVGMTMNSSWVVPIERWESGWRMSSSEAPVQIAG